MSDWPPPLTVFDYLAGYCTRCLEPIYGEGFYLTPCLCLEASDYVPGTWDGRLQEGGLIVRCSCGWLVETDDGEPRKHCGECWERAA